MVVPLPPKVFKILAPAIKGNIGTACEVKFEPIMNVFKSYFKCAVQKRKGNTFKVMPPPPGHGVWYWSCVPFFLHKPVNGTLGRQELLKRQNEFKSSYDWDNKTIVCGRSGARK